jgi:hypothetical protein
MDLPGNLNHRLTAVAGVFLGFVGYVAYLWRAGS